MAALLPRFPFRDEHLLNRESENGHGIDCWLGETVGPRDVFVRVYVSADHAEFARALGVSGSVGTACYYSTQAWS